MPQINLISPVPKKSERSSAPSDSSTHHLFGLEEVRIPLIKHSVICAAVLSLVWIFLSINVHSKTTSLNNIKDEVKALETNPKEIESLRSERAALEKKVKLIDSLSSRKFFWHEKLSLIGDLILDGIWMTDISSKKERVLIKDSKNKPPKGNKKNKADPAVYEERTVLIVRGTAVAYKIQDAVIQVGNFIKLLQNNDDFAKDFREIKLNTTSKGTFGGLDVMIFEIQCVSN